MSELLGIGFAALAILFGGTLKGATGMGAPLIAIPVIAGLYSVPTALAVMTVPLIASNVWQMWTYRHATEGRRALRRMMAGCAVGVGFGTVLLGIAPEAWLAVALSVMLFLYLGLRLARPDMVLHEPRARRAALPVGVVTGVLQGSAGLSTPVGVTFIHAQRLPREAQVFAMSAMFTVLSVTQIVGLSAIGVMSRPLVLASLAGLVPIFLGLWFGQKIGQRISQKTFERVMFVVLTVTALALLIKSLAEIVG